MDTQNATTIGWNEIGEEQYWDAEYLYLEKREYYRHLNRQNGGYKNGPKIANKTYQTYLANKDLIEILAGHLELTQRQEGRAQNRFTDLPLDDLGMSSELVAYCTCAYVVHEDDTSKRKCHPNTPESDRDDLFVQIAEDCGLRKSAVRSMYGKLQHRFDDVACQAADDNPDRNYLYSGSRGA